MSDAPVVTDEAALAATPAVPEPETPVEVAPVEETVEEVEVTETVIEPEPDSEPEQHEEVRRDPLFGIMPMWLFVLLVAFLILFGLTGCCWLSYGLVGFGRPTVINDYSDYNSHNGSPTVIGNGNAVATNGSVAVVKKCGKCGQRHKGTCKRSTHKSVTRKTTTHRRVTPKPPTGCSSASKKTSGSTANTDKKTVETTGGAGQE